MDDAQTQRDVTMLRIASALERIATHYERQDAMQEAERVNYERWLAELARTHLAASTSFDAQQASEQDFSPELD